MTKAQLQLNSVFVRYEGTASFKFFEERDFSRNDVKSNDERSAAEILIETACGEIEYFSVIDAEFDGDCLSASARISGGLLISVPWHHSEALQPDQIKFLKASVVSYLSTGVECVHGLSISLQIQTKIAAT